MRLCLLSGWCLALLVGCTDKPWPYGSESAQQMYTLAPNTDLGQSVTNITANCGAGFQQCSGGGVCFERDFQTSMMTTCPPFCTINVQLDLPKDGSRLSRWFQQGPIELTFLNISASLFRYDFSTLGSPSYYEERVLVSQTVGATNVLLQWFTADGGDPNPTVQVVAASGSVNLNFQLQPTCDNLGEPEFTGLARITARTPFQLGGVVLHPGTWVHVDAGPQGG